MLKKHSRSSKCCFCMNCSDTKPRRISLLAFQTSCHSQPVEAAAGTPVNHRAREGLHVDWAPGQRESRQAKQSNTLSGLVVFLCVW